MMSLLNKITTQIQNLIGLANTTTGKSDTTLTDAVDSLVDGFGQCESKLEQAKEITITENGTTEVTPDNGKVLSKVTVNVDVESGGGSSDFVGIKLSGFTGGYNLPTIADARSLNAELVDNGKNMQSYGFQMFSNQTKSANGGLYAQLKEVYLMDGLKYIGNQMFSNCANLETIHGDFTNVLQVGTQSFQYCAKLTEAPYMPNLFSLQSGGFQHCTGLTEFKFYVKPTDITDTIFIHAGAFTGCTNLKDIYVPWAEGEVANAPWGATNATIHYNTTYDENHNPIV